MTSVCICAQILLDAMSETGASSLAKRQQARKQAQRHYGLDGLEAGHASGMTYAWHNAVFTRALAGFNAFMDSGEQLCALCGIEVCTGEASLPQPPLQVWFEGRCICASVLAAC